MGLWLWSRKEGPVIPMEGAWFSVPKKARQSCSKIKTMLTVFFDWKVSVHPEYTSPWQTINKEYYLNVLCQLRGTIWQKQPQLWATGNCKFYHNNAPDHASCPMQSFLAKRQIIQVTQPPYSPDLAPCNFWLSPKIKSPLKKKFQTTDKIQEKRTG